MIVNGKFLHAIILLFVIISFSFIPQLFSQNTESLTITTYYPAPSGVYQNLRLFPIPTAQAPLCDNAHPDNEGFMYYNNDAGQNQLMVCRETVPGTLAWQAVGASFWTQEGNNLYPNDPSWNVGIGTTNPTAKLTITNGVTDNTLNLSPGQYWNGSAMISADKWFNIDLPGRGNINFSDNVTFTDGDVGIGTLSPSLPAPNNKTGNLDVNDVKLRASGEWLSKKTGLITGTAEQFYCEGSGALVACKYAWGTASCNGKNVMCAAGTTLQQIITAHDEVAVNELAPGHAPCGGSCHVAVVACIGNN